MTPARQRYITGFDSDSPMYSQLTVGAMRASEIVKHTGKPLLVTVQDHSTLDRAAPLIRSAIGVNVSALWGLPESRPVAVMAYTHRNYIVWDGPVLLVWPSEVMLGRIDDLRGATDQVVVPWTRNEYIAKWIRAHAPTLLGGAVVVGVSEKPCAAAVRALQSLTGFVNFGNNLTGEDRYESIKTFRMLIDFDPTFDQDDVVTWLMSEGKWPSEMVKGAAKIMDDLRAGKRLKGSDPPRSQTSWNYFLKETP